MTEKNIETLIETDQHGVYKKPSGDLVLLPVRRHGDWMRKNMTFICQAAHVEDEKVKRLAENADKSRIERAKKLLEKYGESVVKDMPEAFKGIDTRRLKTPEKKKSK